MMRSMNALPILEGARVLVRVDFNVPLKGTIIRDTRRIEVSFKTIDAVLKKGGTPILLAHLGDPHESLRPIATYLSKRYNIVFIVHNPTDPHIKDILARVPKGTVVLLENIRRYTGEEKNSNIFAKALASLGGYYINDAFSVSHRSHASIVGIPKYIPSYAGYQLEIEIATLKKVIENKKCPFVFILGGAKFATKIPLLKQFSKKADTVVVGGALLNNFYMVAGFEIGKSVVEKGFDTPIKKLLKDKKILLPIDVIVVRGTKRHVVGQHGIQKNDTVVDIGPESIKRITKEIQGARLVVWNGPTGWYEKGFIKGTTDLAKAIMHSNTEAIIGGGDTGAVLEKLMNKKTKNKNIFISTGGGAMLDFLVSGTLPGINALIQERPIHV